MCRAGGIVYFCGDVCDSIVVLVVFVVDVVLCGCRCQVVVVVSVVLRVVVGGVVV